MCLCVAACKRLRDAAFRNTNYVWYTLVLDRRQGVVLHLWGWRRGSQLLTVKNQPVTKNYIAHHNLRALVNTVMKPSDSIKGGEFLD
jgi:hypothetical protein